jgi:hypothetical protein
MKSSWLLPAALVGAALLAIVPACGGGGAHTSGSGGSAGTTNGGAGDGGDFITNGSGMTSLASISVDPPQASLEIKDGAIVTQKLAATAHFADGSTQALSSNVSWTVDAPAVGAVDNGGLYTPSGKVGGVVTVTASYSGVTGSAKITVKLHDTQDPGMVDSATKGVLLGASTPDPAVVWAYPYNGTVFPRGLASTPLMWNNGAAGDLYYVHLTSATFELEAFTAAPPPSQFALPDAEWSKFVDSTSGDVDVVVNRWDGKTATQLIHHTWTIAPANLRGTIYYWANNLGRILRIKPGDSKPDDFSAGVVPDSPAGGCTMTCHTVSADGSTLVAAGGTYGGSYDLKANKPLYGLGGGYETPQSEQWLLPAVSPDGQLVVINAMADQLGAPIGQGMFKTADGSPVMDSGLPNERIYMPSFAPDGSSLVFVTGTPPGGGYWASTGAPGTLRMMSFDKSKAPMLSNEHDLVQPGADPKTQVIAWPSVTPDGKWAAYGRLQWLDPTANHNLTAISPAAGDIYMASLADGAEVRLSNINGDSYPFAAGARDLNHNFEPSFAPVAAGGYFWVVFHSRRTFGNVLTGPVETVKQLWIAAIDQNPTPGKDPSHPAFHLPGQGIDTLNLRGYFALDPCKGDGQNCQAGTDCCGGYCNPSANGGPPVCGPKQGCSQDGNHCDQTSDCCDAMNGETCINHTCSGPPPK